MTYNSFPFGVPFNHLKVENEALIRTPRMVLNLTLASASMIVVKVSTRKLLQIAAVDINENEKDIFHNITLNSSYLSKPSN